MRGVIISRSYRIDHMILERGATTSTPSSSQYTRQCRTIALTVQSLHTPDTIVAYCEFKQGLPLPLGLLPGGVVTLQSFRLKTSKAGNSYLTNYARSSIDINDMSNVLHHVTERSRMPRPFCPTPEMFGLPVSSLSGLMMSLIKAQLSRSVVCVRVCHVTVQRLSAEYKCKGCGCLVANGRCTAACVRPTPSLEFTARYCRFPFTSNCPVPDSSSVQCNPLYELESG